MRGLTNDRCDRTPGSLSDRCGTRYMGRLLRLSRHVKAPPTIVGAVGLCLLVAAGRACAQGGADSRVPIIGLPCEGCEAVFDGLPQTLAQTARIAPLAEPGEPMRIEGTVYDGEGDEAPGVIVYAYHTDATGVYPSDDRLRGAAARHGTAACVAGRSRTNAAAIASTQ